MATRSPVAGLRASVSEGKDVSALVVAQLTSAGSRVLEVGIFEGSMPGGTARDESGRAGTPIAEYMLFQEYGTSRGVPESAWFREGLAQNQRQTADMMTREAGRIVTGGTTPEHALTRIAVKIEGDLKRSITDKDLVDTGAARNAVTWQIRGASLIRGKR